MIKQSVEVITLTSAVGAESPRAQQAATVAVSPLSFTDCFRIVAWKAAVFADERWKLGPDWYCATCIRPERDVANRCPNCRLTELYNWCLRDDAADTIADRGGFPDGHTLTTVLARYDEIATLLAGNSDRISTAWSVDIIALARIIHEERAQQKFIIEHEQWRKANAANKR